MTVDRGLKTILRPMKWFVRGDIDGFFGDNAFNQLQRAKRVRDRLTHPKQLSDVLVTQADVQDVTDAYNWLLHFVSDVEKLP